MNPEIECIECGWTGYYDQLLCHPDDYDKLPEHQRFMVCPDCEEIDCFEDIEDYDGDEDVDDYE